MVHPKYVDCGVGRKKTSDGFGTFRAFAVATLSDVVTITFGCDQISSVLYLPPNTYDFPQYVHMRKSLKNIQI
jgi:hypothetical protein